MLRFWKMSAAVSGLALLAGCGDRPPGYTDVFSKQMMYFPANATMSEAKATPAGSDAYRAAYYTRSMEHANYEFAAMQDYRDAEFHAKNAIAAGKGGAPTPTELSAWSLPADKVGELSSARQRLTTALAAGGPSLDAAASGKAVADFNCWVEQQEENFQPADIAYCKDGFFAALAVIEKKESAEVITLLGDVFFDLDRATIKPGFFPMLDKIAADLVADTNMRVQVSGFTDTTGTPEHNMRLSVRRAETVANYLVTKGVSKDRMTVAGFGEKREFLAVPTGDNVNEPRNRRVEVRKR